MSLAPRSMQASKPQLLLIDNYDSFTYNLVQAFLVLGADVQVYRNDKLTVEQALALDPTHLCISPGPGRPDDAGCPCRCWPLSTAASRSSVCVSATSPWCSTAVGGSSRPTG